MKMVLIYVNNSFSLNRISLCIIYMRVMWLDQTGQSSTQLHDCLIIPSCPPQSSPSPMSGEAGEWDNLIYTSLDISYCNIRNCYKNILAGTSVDRFDSTRCLKKEDLCSGLIIGIQVSFRICLIFISILSMYLAKIYISFPRCSHPGNIPIKKTP